MSGAPPGGFRPGGAVPCGRWPARRLPTPPSAGGPSAAWRACGCLAVLCLTGAVAFGVPGCSSSTARSAVTAPAAPLRDAALRARLARGDAARREGRVDEALAEYEQALATDPAHVPSHMRLVETLVSTGRRSVARDRYRTRAASPGATQVERVMAARLETDGSPAAVRTVYVAAAKAAPEDPWWRLALAEVDLAAADRFIATHEEARRTGDRPRAAEVLELARRALSRADSAVENASERDPSLPETHSTAGSCGRSRASCWSAPRGARPRSARPSRRSSAPWPPIPACSTRGRTSATPPSAWATPRSRSRPTSPRSAWRRATPTCARARGSCSTGSSASPTRPRSTPRRRGSAPATRRPLLNAGDGWAAAGRFEDALAAYDQALVRDPSAVEAYAKRGAVLERMGRLAEAREAYAVYVERDGADAAAARRRIERLLTPDEARPR